MQEQNRLDENYSKKKDWLHWGPYLSERQWGTVREDYSANGTAWEYFPHDHARSRTYRWGEDGIAGISDRYCNICFGVALWNGNDPILKERMFGLTGPEGNHGEDVKELYYYLENTPSHSYMKHLYKYPQNEFPYNQLVEENKRRGKEALEFELLDTGIFDDNDYFDVFTEYAKGDAEDILVKISVVNRANKKAKLHLLPTLWIRNFWSFVEMPEKPIIKKQVQNENTFVTIDHVYVGKYNLYFEKPSQLLFTENETNANKIFGMANDHPYKKDLFHDAVTSNDFSVATHKEDGTKFSPLYQLELEAGETQVIKLRLTNQNLETPFDGNFDNIFNKRQEECVAFYEEVSKGKAPELATIQKQSLAGVLWSKQYYNYEIETWLKGDPKQITPPSERYHGRNHAWKTLRNHDIICMPDTWEYPWYAAWDSAFHCISLAMVDMEFAKQQLILFTREWYMKPNGQIPAYEWNFSDVNPPVQAWASMELYKMDRDKNGKGDINFLKRMFNKLSLNFTWWVNRLDSRENNVFEGGFLGLDNIGVFDRSHGIPDEAVLEQVDGTSWMALYCLDMLEMSLEIALIDKSYEDMATKFLGHFVYVAEALNQISEDYSSNWDEDDGFFYDKLIFSNGASIPIKIRSIAGLLSIAAVLCIKKETLEKLPKFEDSVKWFRKHRQKHLKYEVIQDHVEGDDLLLSLVPKERMEILMKSLLDENEFLSDYGIRSLSKIYKKAPYNIIINNNNYCINYEPAESQTGLFGGNSNWRGPIWMPINYLFVQSLKEYNCYYKNSISFECPSTSGNMQNLDKVISELCNRLVKIFKKDANGDRPINKLHSETYRNPNFEDLILFNEYFDGDTGRGVGASHQTGWTALIANLINDI